MENFIVGYGTNTISALRANVGDPVFYVLGEEFKDDRTIDVIKSDSSEIHRFNAMLARGEVKEAHNRYPNITLNEMRSHLMSLYKSNIVGEPFVVIPEDHQNPYLGDTLYRMKQPKPPFNSDGDMRSFNQILLESPEKLEELSMYVRKGEESHLKREFPSVNFNEVKLWIDKHGEDGNKNASRRDKNPSQQNDTHDEWEGELEDDFTEAGRKMLKALGTKDMTKAFPFGKGLGDSPLGDRVGSMRHHYSDFSHNDSSSSKTHWSGLLSSHGPKIRDGKAHTQNGATTDDKIKGLCCAHSLAHAHIDIANHFEKSTRDQTGPMRDLSLHLSHAHLDHANKMHDFIDLHPQSQQSLGKSSYVDGGKSDGIHKVTVHSQAMSNVSGTTEYHDAHKLMHKYLEGNRNGGSNGNSMQKSVEFMYMIAKPSNNDLVFIGDFNA